MTNTAKLDRLIYKVLYASLSALFSFCLIQAKPINSERISFSNYHFTEKVDTAYWEQHPTKGIEVFHDSTGGHKAVRFKLRAIFDSTLFDSLTAFNFVTFDAVAVFLQARFLSYASFDFTEFKSRAAFQHTVFESQVSFSSSTFDSLCHFSGIHFRNHAAFGASNFLGEVQFNFTTFDSIAIFGETHFTKKIDFDRSVFGRIADFKSTKFDSLVSFNDVRFGKYVDFSFAKFNDSALFHNTSFGDSATFRNAIFKKTHNLHGLQLPDFFDFRNINANEVIDLTYCRLPRSGNKCKIALFGTELDKIKINMELFELCFPPDTTLKISDSTFQVIPTREQRISFYEQMLAKLKREGFLKSYEIVEKEYKAFLKDNGSGWQQLAYYLDKWWWDFEYCKERIIFWTISFWLFATLVNSFCYRKLQREVYSIDFVKYSEFENELTIGNTETRTRLKDSNWIKELAFGGGFANLIENLLHYFAPTLRVISRYTIEVLVYTAVIFFGLKIDTDKFQNGAARKHPILFTWIMLIYTIGLVCIGFLANWIFTG